MKVSGEAILPGRAWTIKDESKDRMLMLFFPLSSKTVLHPPSTRLLRKNLLLIRGGIKGGSVQSTNKLTTEVNVFVSCILLHFP